MNVDQFMGGLVTALAVFLLLALVAHVLTMEPYASPNWALMRRFVVRAPDGSVYLWRLRVVETPWFAVWLHAIHREDFGRDLHDHPRSFVSFVLRGAYREDLMVPWYDIEGGPSSICSRRVSWFNFKRACDVHRITWLSRRPTWTLVFCGPRVRQWGFLTDDGWVESNEYFKRGSESNG